MSIQEAIADLIKENDVVLFMKGSKLFPQCGFSGHVVHLLKESGIEFKDINVLESDEMRQGIKDFSNWPTIPQLYIKGEFVGGCDIVSQLAQSGELKKLAE
jgi:monothiol glutaredoxin